ncbi:hypothetical protein FH972_022306 [Carpinus fangiana]|uniref:Protein DETOXIFICATION n=1 Tax=Carpinus fangiana TaxID=176857 RepID=A0A5N6KSI4_9ROSI|nr:hypothetical protein FH972_022306 [Carpinus fangiana]
MFGQTSADESAEDSSDEGPDTNSQTSIPTASENRRRQNALFESWAIEAINEIGTEELSRSTKVEHDAQMSLKSMMARHETDKRIIASPRDYQMELFERAKEQNTIAVLDTGSGKTLIAVLLLQHILDLELVRREAGLHRKVAFFVVDKIMLCQQQFAVLSANLDHKVDQFYGSIGHSIWDKQLWAKNFDENMVIVCTADALLGCLMHSFIKMRQINLLIFDEAHHAKKRHGYAKIIRDFYLAEPNVGHRPRIFGTTASPIDISIKDMDIARAQTKELEELLDAKIATPSDPKALQAFVQRPREYGAKYSPLGEQFETELYKALFAKYWHLEDFKKMFNEAKIQSRELGAWCSDVFWKFALSERQARKMIARTERRHTSCHKIRLVEVPKSTEVPMTGTEGDKESSALEEAQRAIQARDFGKPTLQSISTKVLQLYNVLAQEFERTGDSRVLVFVERKSTAMLLCLLFTEFKDSLKNVSCGFLIGSHVWKDDGMNNTSRDQAVTLMKFRKGEVNCLFATSAAEEGLDIQDCNVVIRFDPVKTMIQYIQSRGRARHLNSKFYHLIERDNHTMHRKISEVTQSAEIMSEFSSIVPEDRILKGLEEDEDFDSRREHSQQAHASSLPVLIEPNTGAKLTFDFALVVLAQYAATIDHEFDEDMSVSYILSRHQNGFVCEVLLPQLSPLKSAIGFPYRKKALAKRSAAFEACKRLRRDGYLDASFLPTLQKKKPTMRNARLAVNDRASAKYKMIQKPGLWAQGRGSKTTTYFLTVINLDSLWQRAIRPLGLLTREPLQTIPEFPIYRVDSQICNVVCQNIEAPLTLTKEISHLTGFTLQIFKDVFNKTFDRADTEMSYWIVPLTTLPADLSSNYSKPSSLIDWELAAKVDLKEPCQWDRNMVYSDIENKFFIDPFHGGRRFYSGKVVPSLRPRDSVPADCAPASGRNKDNILDYTVSLWKKSAERRTWDENQPVLAAEMNSHRLNILARPGEQEKAAKIKAFICPEPLKISLLPPEIAAMATIFPGIISRIESYLIAIEFYDILQLKVAPALALEAITKDSDNSGENGAEKINFQPGMGANYEVLEFIGDTFLKMSTTISIFSLYGYEDEFHMHVHRMLMVCNANLMKNAKAKGYYKYIRAVSFSRRTWYPELKQLGGKSVGSNSSKLGLGDKTIADICEAAIGAALVANVESGYCDLTRFDDAVRAVTHFVEDQNHIMLKWSDYVTAYQTKLPKYVSEESTASQRDLVDKLALDHPYRFRYARIARSAFSHPSYPRSWEPGIPSYERLEFLGDSLLDMACVLHLYIKFGNKHDPQWLTEHKMAMASNKFLGAVCVKLGFHKHMRFAHSAIEKSMRDYVAEISEIEADHPGERDYWVLARDPPKCLPDIVEAYVGAMFVDSGFDFGEVQRFFDMHIKWFFEDMKIYDTYASSHPVTRLYRFLDEAMGCHEYRLMVQEMPTADGMATKALSGLLIHQAVVAKGHASAVRNAKTQAASDFLRQVEGIAPFEFRRRFQCDCKPLEGKSGDIGGQAGNEDYEDAVVDSDTLSRSQTQPGQGIPISSPGLQAADSHYSLAGSYRRPSVVGGPGRNTIIPAFQLPIEGFNFMTEEEREYAYREERSLLRDNDIIPPKHPRRRESTTSNSRGNQFLAALRRKSSRADEEAAPSGEATENTALLSGSTELPYGGEDSPENIDKKWDEAVAAGKIQTTWQREAKVIARYSRSLIATFILQYSLPVTSIFFTGHLGELELGAVSLGAMTSTITGVAIFQGLATSLDTLCSQAYGSGHKKLVGLQMQRMAAFLLVVTIPIAVVWLNATTILAKIVPEKEIAVMAGQYLKIVLIGAPGYAMWESGKRFVQAQGLFSATLYCLMFVAPLNVFLHWLFVRHFALGFIGAPIAVAITENVLPLCLFCYVYFVAGSECWGGFSRAALQNWWPMIKLALPGLVMVLAEYLAFEILTLMSSFISSTHLAAQSLLSTIATIAFQIPFPISIAASTRIANLIGATLAPAAQTTAKVALITSLFAGALNMILLSALRFQLPRLFTNVPEVIELVGQTMPLVATFQLADSVAAICNGILRGLGRQEIGGYVALFAYYGVAMPISIATCFTLHWDLFGLWLGCAVALLLVAVIEAVFILRTDWDRAVQEAQERNNAS